MNESPRRDAESAPDRAVTQAIRRGEAVQARFNRELDALLDDLHAARAAIRARPLPHEHDDQTDQHEDAP
jgi:uncharacterized protein (DUF1697 family)